MYMSLKCIVNVSLEYIANMRLGAVDCICEAMEYICKKIHDILSHKHRENEGDILFQHI